MMQAYGTFANEGYYVKPHFITKVEDIDGNVLYKYKKKKKQILNSETVYILNELLTSSYDVNLLDYNTPTCLGIAPKMTKKYAIKTGTTDTDHLIFGYNHDLIIGAWVGYDDNKATTPNDSLAIKNMWIDAMESSLTEKENSWYDIPKNVVGVLVDPITGQLDSNNKRMFYYIKGTEPYENYSFDDLIPVFKEE